MYAGPMDLRQLEVIRAIAETGSFTAAGHRLHVSQSAISRQVILLEEELGEAVFHRVGRQGADHAGRRVAPPPQPPCVPGSPGHGGRDQRNARVAARHHPPRGRHDRLSLRLSVAAGRSAAGPPEPRPEGHGGKRRTFDRRAARGRGGPGPGDAAGRCQRLHRGAALPGRTAAHHLPRAPAGEEDARSRRPIWTSSRSSCSRADPSPAGWSRSSSRGSASSRTS